VTRTISFTKKGEARVSPFFYDIPGMQVNVALLCKGVYAERPGKLI